MINEGYSQNVNLDKCIKEQIWHFDKKHFLFCIHTEHSFVLVSWKYLTITKINVFCVAIVVLVIFWKNTSTTWDFLHEFTDSICIILKLQTMYLHLNILCSSMICNLTIVNIFKCFIQSVNLRTRYKCELV